MKVDIKQLKKMFKFIYLQADFNFSFVDCLDNFAVCFERRRSM